MERRIYRVKQITAAALLSVAIGSVVTLGGNGVRARSAIEFASFAIAALATGWLISSEGLPRIRAAIVVCTAIPVWGAVQLMLGTTASDFATRDAILNSAVFAALFFVTGQMLEDGDLRLRVLQVLFVIAFVVSVVLLVSPVIKSVNRDHYCVFVELLLPVGLYLVYDAHEPAARYVWAVLSSSLIASALITGSWMGCVLVAAELAIVPLLLFQRDRDGVLETRIPFAAMAGLVVLFSIGMGFKAIVSQFRAESLFNGRSELVTSAFRMAWDRPWTGFGLGAFDAAYPTYAVIGRVLPVAHAYNDWVEWMATGGLPLLAMYLTIFGLMLPLMIRYVWSIGAAAMCLHALSDAPFEVPALVVINAILLGAASASDSDVYENTSAAVRKVFACARAVRSIGRE